ncbi:MAG: Crp/Fnr family transcriptional regulator [Acidimicrobiia bacterium]
MDDAKLTALRKSPILGSLTDAQAASLISIAKERMFDPGDHVVRAGTTGARAMWVILEGKVEVRSGRRMLVEFGPGAHVGEMALMAPEDTPRSADVVAVEPTRTLQITKWDLMPFVKSNPELALAMVEELSKRLAAADAALHQD